MISYYLLRCSGLILIGLLVYAQTFRFDFVFDDNFFIVNNPFIKDFSQIHLMWHIFPKTRLVGIYSFALNYYFNQLAPQGYHVFNFIVHLVGVGLVWALADLLLKITKWLPSDDRLTKELPFIIALFFLVHPCQTQAVTYITQRFESMATVFYLAAVYGYLRARLSTDRVRKIILFGLAGLFTILGILTKEVVITVPAMILACEWILFPKNDHKWLYIVLVAGGVLFYLLFTRLVHVSLNIFLQTFPSESHQGDVLTPAHYFLTQMRVFLTFLRLLVLPVHQNVDYDYPASTGLLHPPLTLMGSAVILGIIFLIIKLRNSIPLIAFGLAWVLITFSINLAPRSHVIFEHKLYLISFGFFLTVVPALSLLIRNRAVLAGILLCTVTVLAAVSFQRNKIWRNEFTLWGDTVLQSPHKARPYNNRGLAYFHQGNLTQAMSDYNRAIEINPDYAEAYNNRGLLYYGQGNFTQAILDYNQAIKKNITYAATFSNYSNRGLAYFHQGNLTRAMSDYDQAIRINPYFAEGYSNRGLLYYNQSNFAQAIADYSKAIEINPDVSEDFNNRGTCWVHQGNFIQAVSDYNKAIEKNPDNASAYNNRAMAYYLLRNYDKAWGDVHKAQELRAVINLQFMSALIKVSGRDK